MRKKTLIAVAVIIIIISAGTVLVFQYYPTLPQAMILTLYSNYTPHIAENSFVRLSLDKAVYSHGEPIKITVLNKSPYSLKEGGSNNGILVWDVPERKSGNCGYYPGMESEIISHIRPHTSFSPTYQPPPECRIIRISHSMSVYPEESTSWEPQIGDTHLFVYATINPP